MHISAVERAGLGTLTENQKVSFDREQGRNGKTSAVNLKAIRGPVPGRPSPSRPLAFSKQEGRTWPRKK